MDIEELQRDTNGPLFIVGLEKALERNEEFGNPTWLESMLFVEAARMWLNTNRQEDTNE